MERKRSLKLSDIITSICTLYKTEGEPDSSGRTTSYEY